MRRPWIVIGLLGGLILAGCAALSATPIPTLPRALGPGEAWLPIIDSGDGHVLCAGGGTIGDFRLHGSATDPRIVWMTEPDGRERTLVWLPGTSARFVPDLEVLDPHGTVIAREGSLITGLGSCKNGLTPEFEQPERSVRAERDPPGASAGGRIPAEQGSRSLVRDIVPVVDDVEHAARIRVERKDRRLGRRLDVHRRAIGALGADRARAVEQAVAENGAVDPGGRQRQPLELEDPGQAAVARVGDRIEQRIVLAVGDWAGSVEPGSRLRDQA